MAGRPKRRAMIAELMRRAEEGGHETPLDYAVEWVASGRTILALAKDISASIGQEIMRERLSAYLNGYEEGAEGRLARARERAGDALADETLEIAEQPLYTKEEVAQAKLQISSRQWLASMWNRATYGEQKAGVTVNVSLADGHINALRLRTVEPEEAEFELIPHSEPTQQVAQLQAGQEVS